MTLRNSIMDALLKTLAASGDYRLVGRRLRDPESIAAESTPALILVDHEEKYENPSPSTPPIRTLTALAFVYFDVGHDENAVPSAVINDLLDGIDDAMQPDSHGTGRFTLGGLAHAVLIDGEIIKASGDVTGKGVARVPIKIILP